MFTQIGLIVLVGMNAILIVFAREAQVYRAARPAGRHRGQPPAPAPILMRFVMGVLPLVLSTGAGAEMRSAMGVAVFAGMIGVTALACSSRPCSTCCCASWQATTALWWEHGAHVAPHLRPHAAGSAAHPVLAAPRHPMKVPVLSL